MINYNKWIAEKISVILTGIDIEEIEKGIEVPPDSNMGDFAFPCFKLSKTLRKSPTIIAEELVGKLETDDYVDKIEQKSGYINFYISRTKIAEEVLKEIAHSKGNFGTTNSGNGKTVLIDYSSPNIAKPFHIGHLRTTLIGNSLYRIYKYLGYNTIGINHLGDYGTQFGKMIEAYKLWGNEYDLQKDSINKMADMYVKINNLCKEDENVLARCRENFKLLEDGDEYCNKIWNMFKDLSMVEFNKIYDILGIKFDSLKGEAFYSDKMQEVIDILDKKGKIVDSEGTKIVDLTEAGINTPCIIQKSDGSSIYATRDLAAILYRARTYDFDKCLYVVAYEQNLHFKQVFEVAKYLVDKKYTNGLIHVSYGMVALPTGKMSSRLGNVVKIEDLINETIKKAKEIIVSKNSELDNKDEVAKAVGISAIVFNTLSTTTNKDQIFDWNTALNFQGETGPYIQYTYVRTKSVLEKSGKIPTIEEVDFSLLQDNQATETVKLLYSFNEVLESCVQKNEPAILARFLIELSQSYSAFYNENKVLADDENIKNARLYLTYAVGEVLKTGANLLGIENMPEKM